MAMAYWRRFRVSETAGALVDAIISETPPRTFLRGGVAVVLQSAGDEPPKISPISPAGARSLFERYAVFKKYYRPGGELELRSTVLDESTAKALLGLHTDKRKASNVARHHPSSPPEDRGGRNAVGTVMDMIRSGACLFAVCH